MCKIRPAMRTETSGEYACESSVRRRWRTNEITQGEAIDGACGVSLVMFSAAPVYPVVRCLLEGGENADIGIVVTLAFSSCAVIVEEGIDAFGEIG
jgi:hypothetical protein